VSKALRIRVERQQEPVDLALYLFFLRGVGRADQNRTIFLRHLLSINSNDTNAHSFWGLQPAHAVWEEKIADYCSLHDAVNGTIGLRIDSGSRLRSGYLGSQTSVL
jgi:hypothetical protein